MSNGDSILQAMNDIRSEADDVGGRLEEAKKLVDTLETRERQLLTALQALSPLSPAVVPEEPVPAAVPPSPPKAPPTVPLKKNLRVPGPDLDLPKVKPKKTQIIKDLVEELLRKNPDKWYQTPELRVALIARHPMPSPSTFSAMLSPSNLKDPNWLRRYKMGRVVYYSLEPSEGGSAPSNPLNGVK